MYLELYELKSKLEQSKAYRSRDIQLLQHHPTVLSQCISALKLQCILVITRQNRWPSLLGYLSLSQDMVADIYMSVVGIIQLNCLTRLLTTHQRNYYQQKYCTLCHIFCSQFINYSNNVELRCGENLQLWLFTEVYLKFIVSKRVGTETPNVGRLLDRFFLVAQYTPDRDMEKWAPYMAQVRQLLIYHLKEVVTENLNIFIPISKRQSLYQSIKVKIGGLQEILYFRKYFR